MTVRWKRTSIWPRVTRISTRWVASPGVRAPHVAEHQAWYAAVNALFGGLKRFVVSDRVLPRRVYLAGDGYGGPDRTRSAGVEARVPDDPTGPGDPSGAVAERAEQGFVKVLTEHDHDRILGVTIVGEQASETLAGFVVAMKYKVGLHKATQSS